MRNSRTKRTHFTGRVRVRVRYTLVIRSMSSYLVAVGEKVPVAVAANELAKLPLRVDGGHSSIGNPIVMPGTYEVLVGVCDSIRVVVHGLVAAEAGDKGLLQALPRCSLLSGVVGGAAPRPSVVSWRQEP